MRADLSVAAQFVADHPEEAALVLEQLSFADAAALLAELEPAQGARLVARLSAALAVDCLRSLPDRLVAGVLSELPIDLAARILVRAGEETRGSWLAAVPEERAEFLRRKLRYPPGTAGALVDPLVLALPEDLSVAEAQKQLRRSAERAYYYVYVVDREQRLVGALDIRELMLAESKATLGAVMHREVVTVSAHADLATVMSHPGWRELDALPVVDGAGVFFGIIRHRMMRQIAGRANDQEAQPMVRTLVSLGELYWTGLSAFLAGVNAAGPGVPQRPPAEEATNGAQ
ncbi:MAG: CBS domain-containing protein [Gemmatimonadetes bacterium]|nr:CBS domain-containing protein [Gemmatimonadota bacterium]MBI2404464.1 CBS domain-containing protein [Gemmatimonadota bacterium]MBI2537055.1 CBS domain-containing protein [Gemmatimonadota bacterium]MBI2614899.1 CBS domain-containing protein [Gemmatimonadota bacterium]MBI3081805.1 CBS domain-containing protein [Gemmatimonadota bacterium]